MGKSALYELSYIKTNNKKSFKKNSVFRLFLLINIQKN